MKISIVIPVYNSQGILPELCRQVGEALSGVSFELILVNDQSPDSSWEVIKKLSQTHPFLIGVNLRKNGGQDNAIMAGLNEALGDYIVIMDDDLQHSPKDVLKLVGECEKGFDVCYANFEEKHQALWKNFGSWFNGKIAEILISKPKEIYLSPFQAITKEIKDEVIKYPGPYPYVQGLILNITNNLTQIPLQHKTRFEGKGNFNFVRSLKVFLKLVTSFSVIPLRFATLVGFTASVLGFLLIPIYIIGYFSTHLIVPGWTTLVLINLIIGGLMLLSIGIIGEYIGRMYLYINLKPQFVVKEKVGTNRDSSKKKNF